MTLYVLNDIAGDRTEQLRAAGVPFSSWRHGSIIVEGEYALRLALETLGASVVAKSTKYESLVELKLRFAQAPPMRAERETPEHARSQKTRQTQNRSGQSRENSRAAYIRACKSRLSEIRKNAEQTSATILEQVRRAECNYWKAVRADVFRGMPEPELMARFTEEFATIRSLPKVKGLHVTNHGLVVFTDPLVLVEPDTGVRRTIGEFTIVVRLVEPEAGIYWFNGTRRITGANAEMNAPYVYADGKPCNDEVKQVFFDQLARCELASLVDLAIQFIETVNPQSPLNRYLARWPLESQREPATATPRLALWQEFTRAISRLAFWKRTRRLKPLQNMGE